MLRSLFSPSLHPISRTLATVLIDPHIQCTIGLRVTVRGSLQAVFPVSTRVETVVIGASLIEAIEVIE